jgi:high-affinity iron transporter
MLQSFIIILREGFESFLLVAVILAYLRKTGQRWLLPAVYSAIAVSVLVSAALGYELQLGVNESLWEGVLGVVAIVMVATLVIHMWKTAPLLKKKMEKRLGEVSSRTSRWTAFGGVFLFTVLMISREGMETALMLLQVKDGRLISGALLGLLAAIGMAWAWARFGHLINIRRFFQVTGIFLLLFMVQVAIYSFHEFAEAGLLPNSDALHAATEKFSPDGLYGKWFSLAMVSVCGLWLCGAWFLDRIRTPRQSPRQSKVTLEQA